jgi:hypothetical protein
MQVRINLGCVFLAVEMEKARLGHDSSAGLCQLVNKRWRAQGAVFDAVAVARSRPKRQRPFNSSEGSTHCSFFHRVQGDLKATPMSLPYHFGEIVRWWIQFSSAFVHHDFHAAQTHLLVSAERRAAGFDHLWQGIDANHNGRTGFEDAARTEALKEGKIFQGIPGAGVVK